MARRFATLKTSIWENPDFLALPPGPQRLYLFLMSQKDLPLTGVLVRRTKWARAAAGYDPAQLDADLQVLVAARFVVVDHDTDEVWLRTFMYHDGVLANRKLRTGARNRVDAIHSDQIRALVTGQLDAADDPPSTGDTSSDALSDGASALWTEPHEPKPAHHTQSRNRASDRASDDPPDTPPPSSHLPRTTLSPSQSDPPPHEAWVADPAAHPPPGTAATELIHAALDLVADHALAAQRARGAHIRSERAWRAEARRRADDEHTSRALDLVTAFDIPDPKTLADLLTGRRTLATSHIPRRHPGAA